MKPVRAKEEIDKIKEKILNCSLDIIVSDGFPALTMRRLAREIGMTAPNIYNYFSNKDEIYLTLMIKGFDQLVSSLQAEINNHADSFERIRSVMAMYLEFGIENKRYYEIMFSSSSPKYRDYIGTDHEALSTQEHDISMQLATLALTVVQEFAVQRGKVLDVNDARVTLTMLWSLLHGMINLHNSQNIDYLVDDVSSVYDSIVDRVMAQIDVLF